MNNIKEENCYEVKKNNKIIKINKVALIAILSFIVLNICITINILKNKEISNEVIRLHVVANSNSIDDQIEKLKIHSKIQEYINSLNISRESSKADIINEIENNINELLEIADSTLKHDNFDYSSKVKIGKINYEEKQSITYDMPAGSYDSIQVVLGDGSGINIWSFIFPNEENIEKLSNYDTILPGISNIYNKNKDNDKNENEDDNIEKVYSFKSVEIIENIASKIKSIF